MEQNKPFFKMIDEICKEENIKQKKISYNWIRQLTKGDKTHYIMSYQLDLNSANSYNIAHDKFATYDVLKSNNVPTIEHRMIFNPSTRSKFYGEKFIKDAENLLLENNNKVVIKANESCEGKDVYFCSDKQEIEDTVNKLFKSNKDTLSACPYVDIDYEYRAIYLCDEILYIYKKKKASVVGDGKRKLFELIEEKNQKNNINIEILKNLDLQYIPKLGEEITISWKHNLSNGATPIIIDDKDKYIKEIKEIALSAGKAMNINFASIDIALTSDEKIFVMEVNGSVCMNKFSEVIPNGYEISKNIYKKAIQKMFE